MSNDGCVKGDSQQSRIPTIWATAHFIQKFRFHLLFGVRFSAIATVTILLLLGLLAWTSSAWTHSTSSLLKGSLFSLSSFLGVIHVIPLFIGSTLGSSMVIYGTLMVVQWFVVGFGVSFLFRSRHWFFNSTILFWLLFPLTFVPLILTYSGPKYWCGFGLGQPWEWLYYCEDVGATFFSLTAFFEDLFIGLLGVILLRQLAKFAFGRSAEIKPQE